MSCNTCQAKFSFFTKENGCPSCGFSYCSKCLKYKCNLSDVGEKKICGRCFNKLQKKESPITPTDDFSIPDGLAQPLVPIDITKRLDSLENPSRPPITMYKGSKLDKLQVVLDPVDQEIVNRLKKLKNEDKRVPRPTEDDIRRRLALLKDVDPDILPQPVNLNKVDTRTPEQKTNDLISEYLDRLEISKASEKTDDDIKARLDALRGVDSSKYKDDPMASYQEYDEATSTKKIIEKAIAESALESIYEGNIDELEEVPFDAPSQNSLYEENLDTCCMCDNTKNLVMCRGCTGDLYCPHCFKNNHDEFENHKTVPYKPSRRIVD
ncbi:abscission/NoCut checkpoint regulator-like isoform X1 [Phymastichus coffea]|uniref:abscission/NoCut checkpoint regulator-like isoform X1 n=1 Tax=Phymastichus coffea TaxID=108790 RepID=UPI00273CD863|nr:abscission/NoCut checkpoint regulator-like isoform X1 [Phymastichus coffea]XP_058809586.1 abscission/NoCut checkpoint regulator-like isoform X1 [Phymastichus coffea]